MNFLKRVILILAFGWASGWSALVVADPALWLVEGEEGEGKAYLFGAVHFGNEILYPLPDVVLQAFAKSDLLAVEIDAEEVNAAEAARALQLYGYNPASVQLSEQLKSEEWQQLLEAFGGFGISERQLNQLKPWLAAMQLTAHQIRQLGYKEQLGIDHYFLSRAKNSHGSISVVQLETLEGQLALFDSMPHSQQLEFLSQSLEGFLLGDDTLSELINAWLAGDEESLERELSSSFTEEIKSFEWGLFGRRNQLMLTKIVEKIARDQVVFVVVGAGHMVGEHGLKSLFDQRGFRITRIR